MNGKKALILVVDDNEVILRTLSLKLKANDYEVATATDGATALGVVRRQKPALILLDIMFPDEGSGVPWDGFRMIEWFKRMEEAKTIPIIVITGGDTAKYQERALASGASAFFQKPVNNEELLAAIENIVTESVKETAAS